MDVFTRGKLEYDRFSQSKIFRRGNSKDCAGLSGPLHNNMRKTLHMVFIAHQLLYMHTRPQAISLLGVLC